MTISPEDVRVCMNKKRVLVEQERLDFKANYEQRIAVQAIEKLENALAEAMASKKPCDEVSINILDVNRNDIRICDYVNIQKIVAEYFPGFNIKFALAEQGNRQEYAFFTLDWKE